VVFWVVMPSNVLIFYYQRFEGTYRLHFQSSREPLQYGQHISNTGKYVKREWIFQAHPSSWVKSLPTPLHHTFSLLLVTTFSHNVVKINMTDLYEKLYIRRPNKAVYRGKRNNTA
jgi:hypothetical protein